MTAALNVDVRRQQLLAFVLAFVLVWYTFVVPASAASPRRFERDDEGHDGEVRGLKPQAVKSDSRPVEDLDWPEYIYP